MRRIVLCSLLAAAAPLAAQTSAPPRSGDSSVGYLYLPGAAPSIGSDAKTTAEIFAGLKLGPPPEQRTPAQLQAVLESYVGRWVGKLELFVVNANGPVMRTNVPIEMLYTLEKHDGGKNFVRCILYYKLEGKDTTEVSTRWVEDGKILSESMRGARIERHIAVTRGPSLVWFADARDFKPTDYSVIETLRLTPDGGTLTMNGYMRLPGTEPMQLMQVTGELKLMPPS